MGTELNKTRIAKRVIEVFEYFSENQVATVMDIVRRYGRPQSSTSELLASLVDLGLLYKDPLSRSYSPTPRLATLGTSAQPEMVRNGRLFGFMDRLANSTGYGVTLFGMVGTRTQIFRWSGAANPTPCHIGCGASEPLCQSTAGLLLLSTLSTEQATRILWRLNAEAGSGAQFSMAELGERVLHYRRQGHATGPSGFVSDHQLTAVLLPNAEVDHPLALGLIYPAGAVVDDTGLIATLARGAALSSPREEVELADVSEAVMKIAV